MQTVSDEDENDLGGVVVVGMVMMIVIFGTVACIGSVVLTRIF